MKNRHTEEELTPVNRSNYANTVSDPNEHPTRLASRWKPVPEELVAHLKTPELRVSEVLLDRLLKQNHVDPMKAQVILE
jgi:hypothetical protein